MKPKIWSMTAGIVLFSACLFGCATIGREQERKMNHTADQVLSKMVLQYSWLPSRLGRAPGYLIVERSGSGIPMVGKRGTGILTDLNSGERVSTRLLELEIDGAWGVGDYTALYIFQTPEDFSQALTNAWHAENAGEIFVSAGGEASARYDVKRISIERR